MIFENQTDLLTTNIKINSKNIVRTIANDLQNNTISQKKDENLENLKTSMVSNGVDNFIIFDKDGNVWHEWRKDDESKPIKKKIEIDKGLQDQIKEISPKEDSVFTAPYKSELNDQNFTINFLMKLKTEEEAGDAYLKTVFSIQDFQSRLNNLYYQIFLAVVWGIIFHTLFGIYVYRLIFVRVGALKIASDKMATGDLKSRAEWKFNKMDELDNLGIAFNTMAGNIEDKIETILAQKSEIEKQKGEIEAKDAEIQHELDIGQEVQELFLPPKKRLKQFNVATYYQPMRKVSGDIYHFYKFPSGSNIGKKKLKNSFSGLFFADASGHGPSAAIITVSMVLSLDSILQKTINPGVILQKLSEIVGKAFQASFFATGVFFLISENNTIFCSNAGHNPPIHYRPSTGEMFFIKSSGPPIGMREDFVYKVERFKAQPGDKIFIYSDGLTESPNTPAEDSEQFGEERVIRILKENIEMDNKDVLKLLAKELDEFKYRYLDDVSMILLEIP